MLKTKILIFLLPLFFLGCSWEYEYTYEIENKLEETLIVKTSIYNDDCFMVKDSLIRIAPNETKILAHDTSNSASAKYHVPECQYEDEDLIVPTAVRFDLFIDGKLITKDLRKFKFWEYIAEKRHSIYRLTIDEELIKE